jgi:bacterioferritin-associated ferredoxin
VYVCLCNGLTERDIRSAARSGAASVDEVYRRLGGAPICCCCVDTAQAIIDGRPIGAETPCEPALAVLAVADAA